MLRDKKGLITIISTMCNLISLIQDFLLSHGSCSASSLKNCIPRSVTSFLSTMLFISQLQGGKVKLRLIDVGRTEDFDTQKIHRVPPLLTSIPRMAFQCMLFEEKPKISYNERFRFNDLVRKKILNLTCRNTECDGSGGLLVYGDMETIVDEPPVSWHLWPNCTEKITLSSAESLNFPPR